jgi:2-methylcitrate dehydratase PrpD
MAAGLSKDSDSARLTDRLGDRWATAETSFKFHASCRHTHPAADALLQVMQRERLQASDIESVVAQVHQGAIDVLGPVTNPQTVHQSKFSMGTVLGLIAVHGRAGLVEFDQHFQAAEVTAFRDRVTMQLDAEVDGAYPARWLGRVQVRARGGRQFTGRVDEPKGDPGNSLTRQELEQKALRLAGFRAGASAAEMQGVIGAIWRLAELQEVPIFLDASGP